MKWKEVKNYFNCFHSKNNKWPKTKKEAEFSCCIKNYSRTDSEVFFLSFFLQINIDYCIKIKSKVYAFVKASLDSLLFYTFTPSSPGKFELKQVGQIVWTFFELHQQDAWMGYDAVIISLHVQRFYIAVVRLNFTEWKSALTNTKC